MRDLFAPQRPEIAPHVLFVCTGNICRSAYAQQSLRVLLANSPNRFNLTVESAGTFAVVGHGIDKVTAEVVQSRGLPMEHHARQISEDIVDSSGLILVMTLEHRNEVLKEFPSLTHRTFTLAEFASLAHYGAEAETFSDAIAAISQHRYTATHGDADDVPDPYRKPLPEHVAAADQIDRLLHQALPALGAVSRPRPA